MHRRTVSHWPLVSAACLLLLFLLVVFSTPARAQAPSDDQMLQAVAARYQIPLENLHLMSRSESTLDLTSQKLWLAKAMDKTTGIVYGIAIDAKDAVVDDQALLAQEQAARAAKYGKLSPKLYALLQDSQTASTDQFDIIVFLNESQGSLPTRPSPEEARRMTDIEREAEQKANVASVKASTASVVQTFLQSLGPLSTRVRFSSEVVPVVTMKANRTTLQFLDQHPSVRDISLAPLRYSTMNTAGNTVNAQKVRSRSITGSGSKLAVLEVGDEADPGQTTRTRGGGNIYSNSLINNNLTRYSTGACPNPADHGTGVMGVIKSTSWFLKGIAPDVTAWVGGACQGDDSTMFASTEQATTTWGARILNLSWGSGPDTSSLDADDKYYDTLVRVHWQTVVVAAGNEGDKGTGHDWVRSPAKAYNVIAVGNVNDKDTSWWWDDAMASSSSFRDPGSYNNDRQKPEVSAPGTSISTLYRTGGYTTDYSGTSFASPIVAAGVALLMQRDHSLDVWPEGVKAFMMASANHNIEGSALLSDKDGAGGINLDAADKAVRNGWWGSTGYLNCADYPRFSNITERTFYAGYFEHVRLAVVWTQDPTYGEYWTLPGADLDISVLDPSGNYVTSSASWDNTYEIADFHTGFTAGNYKLTIRNFRCDASPGWIAYAWYREPQFFSASIATFAGTDAAPVARLMDEKPGNVDFDGDGKSDLALWRPSDGYWHVQQSSQSFNGTLSRQWGASTDIAVPGRYSSSNRTDMAVWRPSNGTWYILTAASGFNSSLIRQWGTAGDILTPGDYDHDGRTDIAVWRPSNGTWYILTSSSSFNSVLSFSWGAEGDQPIVRDFDRDGRVDPAVWRPSSGTWYILTSSSNYNPAAAIVRQWGSLAANDELVVGQFDGHASLDFGVYRPSNGTWYILLSGTGWNTSASLTRQWGDSSLDDVPIPKDYDGDGRMDIAIWRTTTGTWHILTSSSGYNPGAALSQQWGDEYDILIAGNFDGDTRTDLGVWRPSENGLEGMWYLRTWTGSTIQRQWGTYDDLPQ